MTNAPNFASSAILLQGVDYRYRDRAALQDASFHVNSGEIFGLVGPNGSGKSTLFGLLTTSLAMQSGSIRIAGFDPRRQPHEVRRRLGVVFQNPSLDRKLTIWENLRHHARLYGVAAAEFRSRSMEMLNRFGLVERRNDLVETLSGGMARRVELAKALMHRPAVLILDEPSTGLDPSARHDLWLYLKQAQADGVAVLLTTHWMEEAERCDRIGILHEGRIVALGAPEALRADVGGAVIEMTSTNPQGVNEWVTTHLGVPGIVDGNAVAVTAGNGFEAAGRILKEIGPSLLSLKVASPTLDHVFAKKTGRRFEAGERGGG